MSEFLSLYITAPSCEVAEIIGRALIEERLAACVNIIDGMRSIYRWKDRVETANEVVMIAKSRATLFEQIEKRVCRNCTLTAVLASWRGQSRPAISLISTGWRRKRPHNMEKPGSLPARTRARSRRSSSRRAGRGNVISNSKAGHFSSEEPDRKCPSQSQ